MTWLDVMTLAIIVVVIIVSVIIAIWFASLPGQIARQRAHPQSDAINVLGWLSLLTLFATWPVALVWAYVHPLNRTAETSERTEGGTSR